MPHRIQQLQQHHSFPLQNKTLNKATTPFKNILSAYENIKLSKHAKQRLNERDIHINSKQWKEISLKMQEAKQKGVTDSLVVMNHATLLVSTKNNTVVTAMNHEEATSRIFTNINGTILINE